MSLSVSSEKTWSTLFTTNIQKDEDRKDPFQNIFKKTKNDLNIIDTNLKERAIKIYVNEQDPEFNFTPAVVQIPKTLNESSPEVSKVASLCYQNYRCAMKELEDSIADALAINTPLKEFINRVCGRLLTAIEKYAEVAAEERGLKPLEAELFKHQLLADTYLCGEDKMKDFAGNVGSNPIAIIKGLLLGNLREQIFLVLSLKTVILKKMIRDSLITQKINEKLLKEGFDWQLEFDPRYGDDGLYEDLTDSMELRLSGDNEEDWKQKNNPTIETGDTLRFPPSEREKRYATKDPVITNDHRNLRYSWSAGAAIIKPVTAKEQPDNPYLIAAENLCLPLIAGISGSTDGILATVHALGLNTKKDLYLTRMACLAFLISVHSHSAYEVMTSAKSFGLKFHPSPDYYKQIDPVEIGFLEELAKCQKRRGFKMPDYYLTEEHFKEVQKQIIQA